MRRPTLVMSTDGVGTKVLVALDAERFDTVGEDLVNHSVNDILVHGARPIAFMDYIAGSGLGVGQIADIVSGIARACRAHEMALAGGETAQMPGLYREGTYDLAGTIVGVVEADRAIHGEAIVPGDVLLGYASTGLHTNGFTLARKVIFQQMGLALEDRLEETGGTVADALLAVHRSYQRSVTPVLEQVHGLAHITGGGIPGNLVRILPQDCTATVDPDSWELPALFRILQQAGRISPQEMREVFNLGVGFIAVLPLAAVTAAQAAAAGAGVTTWVMGEIHRGNRAVRFARP
jgi:phosphoribosylformylglycinamidine cyclo-ligase